MLPRLARSGPASSAERKGRPARRAFGERGREFGPGKGRPSEIEQPQRRRQTGKHARRRAGKEAPLPVGKRASGQAGNKATRQAGKQTTCKQERWRSGNRAVRGANRQPTRQSLKPAGNEADSHAGWPAGARRCDCASKRTGGPASSKLNGQASRQAGKSAGGQAGDPFSGQAGHAAGRRVRQHGSIVSSPGSEARGAKQAVCVGRAASPVINEQRRTRAGSSTMASASRATADDLATPEGPGVGSFLGHDFLGQSGRHCSGRGLPCVVAWPACVGSVDLSWQLAWTVGWRVCGLAG